ncbi:CoA transferase [Jatrophihabitans sp.]|uniref:CaiB/BaiF CoA transferase family protein n=1 Tax=Jatrophihabitans sp. TaxID=1932789 RepID=UPI0030C770E8|nr:L-carnitine dehydratase/bile acid-inducible protein [Jatrophihabitans sp.]
MSEGRGPLAGVRILEASLYDSAAVSTPLADLGADVIKIEPPNGDPIRGASWPLVHGTSLMHLHVNRGKRCIALDLREAPGRDRFLELAAEADVVVEAMRPGGLDRRGLTAAALWAANPRLVLCRLTGYGLTGPMRDMPAHAVAFDTLPGILDPVEGADGRWHFADQPSIGLNAGPLYGALAILAGVIEARATGRGHEFDVAQADAAAAFDWYRIETAQAYHRPDSDVTGLPADGGRRRPAGMGGLIDGVRQQVYPTSDGRFVYLMALEEKFWIQFCAVAGCAELAERWPGAPGADDAAGDVDLADALRAVFAQRTVAEWLALAEEHGLSLAPVTARDEAGEVAQFRHRMPWLPAAVFGADQLPSPIKLVGRAQPDVTPAAAAPVDPAGVSWREISAASDSR